MRQRLGRNFILGALSLCLLGLAGCHSSTTGDESPTDTFGWEQLQQVFSNEEPQAPSVNTDPLAKDIWVNGDLVKYELASLQIGYGAKFQKAIDLLQGIKLTRSPTQLEISIYLSDSVDIDLNDEAHASDFELYRVHLPKTIRTQLANTRGVLTLVGLDQPQGEDLDRIYLEVKIPVLSNNVYLKRVVLALDTGRATLEAGILGNGLSLIGRAQFFTDNVKPKFDLWESIKDNLGILNWNAVNPEKQKANAAAANQRSSFRTGITPNPSHDE